jgi:hypothetical protein
MPAFGSQPGLPAFTAANNKIFMDGKPIRLRGANWFGFEGANAVVDGLWERPMSEYVGFLASQAPPAQGTARKPGSAQRAAAVVTRKVKETVGKARGRELVPTHDME